MYTALAYIAAFIIAFLLGSVPWGVIMSKLLFHDDVRQHGSGNIGMTNVWRTYGAKAGLLVFVLDFAKGLLSGVVAALAFALWQTACPEYGSFDIFARTATGVAAEVQTTCIGLAFLGCVWGHIFSPWLGFKGGKGIAVAVGCLFVTFGPALALGEFALFLVVVLLTRYISAGSIASAVACPFFALYVFWGYWPAWACCTIAGLTVVWAHRANIKRLASGTESTFNLKKDK